MDINKREEKCADVSFLLDVSIKKRRPKLKKGNSGIQSYVVTIKRKGVDT
jgi:DNA-binding winged helix-turn-helix (wHTH) protein